VQALNLLGSVPAISLKVTDQTTEAWEHNESESVKWRNYSFDVVSGRQLVL